MSKKTDDDTIFVDQNVQVISLLILSDLADFQKECRNDLWQEFMKNSWLKIRGRIVVAHAGKPSVIDQVCALLQDTYFQYEGDFREAWLEFRTSTRECGTEQSSLDALATARDRLAGLTELWLKFGIDINNRQVVAIDGL